MKTYEILEGGYRAQDSKTVLFTTESLTNFLLELGYTDDEITQLLSNPTTRACVEIILRFYVTKKNFGKKVLRKKL